MKDFTKRVLDVSAIVDPKSGITGVDLNGIVRRLILFDTYILKSLRLQEFPYLVATLGYDGTMELLKSRAFEIECECVQVCQLGQTTIIESRAQKYGGRPLPALSYCLSSIDAHDHEEYVHKALQPLHGIPGLSQKQVIKLKRAIVNRTVRAPENFASSIAKETNVMVRSRPDLVWKSLHMTIQRELNVVLDDFNVKVEPIDDEDVRVETDLPKRLNITEEAAHKLVEQGLLAVGSMAQRFGEMNAYSALTGFIGNDLPLVHAQLQFLATSVSPETKNREFSRVMTIAGMPDFSEAVTERKVNMGRLLEVREMDECREFRDWLATIGDASDKDIEERLNSLRSRLGNAIATNTGKAIRLVVTEGLGAFPLLGKAATIADAFLLEKLLPKSGPVAFVRRLYPSIFEKPKKVE